LLGRKKKGFFEKKTLAPKKYLPARFSSEARKSA
jgi:hypothetical protein